MTKLQKAGAKVVSFERGADYYFLKYQRQLDRGAYLDALDSLRAAVKKEPENSDYKLALAEFCTEINYFEESNYWVLDVMSGEEDIDGQCLFLLGCNFFGLQEEGTARECLEKYLEEHENGEYALDAQDFLEMMDFDAEEYGVPRECLERSDLGRDYLDRGEYEQAISVLGEICEEHPELDYAKNNLALAYYCQGDTDRAVALCKEVLARNSKDAYAMSNLVLFYLSMDNPEMLLHYCNQLDQLSPQDVEEKIKVALTYCELNEDEKAYQILRDVLCELPYDQQTLFLAGAAAANTGRLGDSLDYFLRMMKLRPEDTVALYYKNLVQSATKTGEEVFISYNYQVPPSETHRRITYLYECFRQNTQQLEKLWREDDYFSSMLIWGMNMGNDVIKKAIFQIICKFQDEKALDFFKRFLLSRFEPDEMKNEALLCLSRMNVPQPYIACLSGKIAEVRVGVVEEVGENFTASHNKVLEEIISLATDYGWKQYMPGAIELMGQYLKSFKKAPAMRSVKAWAGAFLCLAAQKVQKDLSSEMQICAGVEPASFLRCMRAVQKKLEGKK